MDPSVLAVELGLVPSQPVQTVADVVNAVIATFHTTTTTSSLDSQLILPPSMHSPVDVRRWYVLNPTFVSSLLTALLRECSGGSRNHLVPATCRSIVHILQSIAPIVNMPREGRLFDSFLATASVSLDYIVGAHTALSVAAAILYALSYTENPPTSVLKVIGRRLEEASKDPNSWSTEAAALACILTIEYLRPMAALEVDQGEVAAQSPWDALTRGPVDILSGRSVLSGRGGSAARRDMSPESTHGSSLVLSFPEKLPTNYSLPTSVMMSCVALSTEAVLTSQQAINLGNWFLTSLDSLPLTVTATALTQLLMRHGRTFKVISATIKQEQPMKFCEATIVVCSRAVTTLYEQRVQHGVHASYAFGDHEAVDDWDAILHAVDVIPSFTILILQAVRSSQGLLLCAKAQAAIGKLFVFLSRLFVSHRTYTEEATDRNSRRFSAHRVVEQCLRAVARAVDTLLHDYEAGCPELLRADLVASSAPNSSLLNRVESVSGGNMTDLLETIFAASAELPIADPAARTMKLAGHIPAYEEWSAQQGDFGLSRRAKLWAARKMGEYLRREWYLAKAGINIATVSDGSQQSFFDCLPRPV